MLFESGSHTAQACLKLIKNVFTFGGGGYDTVYLRSSEGTSPSIMWVPGLNSVSGSGRWQVSLPAELFHSLKPLPTTPTSQVLGSGVYHSWLSSSP